MLVEAPKPFKSSTYRIGANFRLLGSPPIEHAELFLTVCGIERCSPDKAYGQSYLSSSPGTDFCHTAGR